MVHKEVSSKLVFAKPANENSSSESFRSVVTDEEQTDHNLTLERSRKSKGLPSVGLKKNVNDIPSTSRASEIHINVENIPLPPQKKVDRRKSAPRKFIPITRPKSPKSKKNNKNRLTETRALKEIRHFQAITRNFLPKIPFSRVVREILLSHGEYGIMVDAFECLQESAEMYLTQFFEDANRCTLYRGRVTLSVKDMELVKFMRAPFLSGGANRHFV